MIEVLAAELLPPRVLPWKQASHGTGRAGRGSTGCALAGIQLNLHSGLGSQPMFPYL